MLISQDVNKSIEIFEQQTRERINKQYSDLQRDINESLTSLLEKTVINAENIDRFILAEVDNLRRELFGDGKFGETVDSLNIPSKEYFNEGNGFEMKSSTMDPPFNKTSSFDSSRNDENIAYRGNGNNCEKTYPTSNFSQQDLRVSSDNNSYGNYKDGTPRIPQSFNRFEQLNHEKDFQRNDQTNTYQCKVCSYSTSITSTMKTHMEKAHNERRNFICPQCGYAFPAEGSMTLHIKTYHFTEHKYNCKVCGPGMAFTELKKLEAHMKRKHYDL